MPEKSSKSLGKENEIIEAVGNRTGDSKKHKFAVWPKAEKILKMFSLILSSNLKESRPILMICN